MPRTNNNESQGTKFHRTLGFFDFPHHLRRKRDEKEDKNNFFEKKLQKHLVV